MGLSHAFRRLLTIPTAVVAVLCATAGSAGPTAAAVAGTGPAPVVREVHDPPKRVKDGEGVWAYYLRR
ncbi:hypothetical protein ACFXGA_18295 [Actinosynnema sp. NPDC059335]|uniref:hypothetical protein n=1 Tax=Actinosynnema sp. NPDC059335 TaxID=3346804 RepID=UPI003672FF35